MSWTPTRRHDCATAHHLTDDLISELIRTEDDGDRLSHSELLMLAGSLLAAGTDTTRNQYAAAIEALIDHPTSGDLPAAHPNFAGHATDELMRYSPVVFGVRCATEDVDIAGVTIPPAPWSSPTPPPPTGTPPSSINPTSSISPANTQAPSLLSEAARTTASVHLPASNSPKASTPSPAAARACTAPAHHRGRS